METSEPFDFSGMQAIEHVASVGEESLMDEMKRLIELGAFMITVSDDRGGSGCFIVNAMFFPPDNKETVQ